MRPPGAILAPGETIIATGNTSDHLLYMNNSNASWFALCLVLISVSIWLTVFKFVEHPENNENVLQKCKVKFKILSLKVKGPMDYAPEMVSYCFSYKLLLWSILSSKSCRKHFSNWQHWSKDINTFKRMKLDLPQNLAYVVYFQWCYIPI